MSKTGYFLISIPPPDSGSPYDALKKVISIENDLAEVSKFPIPDLKIGTLDALVAHAEELIKIDTQCEGYVLKIADVLKTILQGDQDKIEEQQVVNDTPTSSYLREFRWNAAKYRSDKSIGDLIEQLNREGSSLESDVRTKFTQYNSIKSQLQQYQRRATGNLSTKHLGEVVRKEHVLTGSDYMETLFFAIPVAHVRDWEKSYESLTQMVVPRSSNKISEDKEFALMSVVVFKKVSNEFKNKARDMKFVPRDFTYDKEEMQKARKDYEEASQNEKRLWAEVLRLSRAAFGDAFQSWMHLKALRVFVESVLRYGLPPRFECAIVKPHKKSGSQLRKVLNDEFAHLGSQQFEKKKPRKGEKVRGGQDGLEESVNALEGSLGIDSDYTPYVIFGVNWDD